MPNHWSIETGDKTPMKRVEVDFAEVVKRRFVIAEGDPIPPIINQRTETADLLTGTQNVVTCTVQLSGDSLQRGIRADIVGGFNRIITISALAFRKEADGDSSRSKEIGTAPHPDFAGRLSRLLSEGLDTSLSWGQI